MTSTDESLRKLLGRAPDGSSMTTHRETPPEAQTQAEAILADHFELGKWHHYDNHVCKVCRGAFLEEKMAVEHWVTSHSGWTPPPETDIVDTGLVAPSGNSIFKEVPVDLETEKEGDE